MLDIRNNLNFTIKIANLNTHFARWTNARVTATMFSLNMVSVIYPSEKHYILKNFYIFYIKFYSENVKI